MTTRSTTLSLADARAELTAIARDAQSAFGALDERQLNWRPDATRWSVAQCLDICSTPTARCSRGSTPRWMTSRPRTVWQRLPVLPRVFGRMLITSQMPEATRKFTAPRKADPASSAIDAGIVERFVAHQHEAAARVRSLDGAT